MKHQCKEDDFTWKRVYKSGFREAILKDVADVSQGKTSFKSGQQNLKIRQWIEARKEGMWCHLFKPVRSPAAAFVDESDRDFFLKPDRGELQESSPENINYTYLLYKLHATTDLSLSQTLLKTLGGWLQDWAAILIEWK